MTSLQAILVVNTLGFNLKDKVLHEHDNLYVLSINYTMFKVSWIYQRLQLYIYDLPRCLYRKIFDCCLLDAKDTN